MEALWCQGRDGPKQPEPPGPPGLGGPGGGGEGLGAMDIVVVLDNHVSLPKWCCSDYDGNGFFGDEYFDPDEWLQGLTTVATRYAGNPTVSGFIKALSFYCYCYYYLELVSKFDVF